MRKSTSFFFTAAPSRMFVGNLAVDARLDLHGGERFDVAYGVDAHRHRFLQHARDGYRHGRSAALALAAFLGAFGSPSVRDDQVASKPHSGGDRHHHGNGEYSAAAGGGHEPTIVMPECGRG